MEFQRTYIHIITSRLLRGAVFCLALGGASFVHSSIALQKAWNEFSVEVAPYKACGLDTTRKIMKTAFLLSEQEVIAVKSTQVFIELFDALLTKVSQTCIPESASCVQVFRDHLFNHVLSSPVLRQKIALEIFKNHKKWGIVMTNTGLVASVDTDVFMGFVGSLKSIFVSLTGGGARFVSHEDLHVLNKIIDDLNVKFKPNAAVVALKGAGHVAARGLKTGARVTHKLAAGTYHKSMSLLSKIDASVLKQAVLMAGAVSVTALVISGSYMLNNKKRLARELIEMAGGKDEVKRTAAKMYLMPESRTKRMMGWLRSWSHDDAEFRASKALEVKQCLTSAVRPDVVKPVDPLREVLLEVARNPETVRPDSVGFVQELMAQDVQDKFYHDKRSVGKDKSAQSEHAFFKKAAREYLKALGHAPSRGTRFGKKSDALATPKGSGKVSQGFKKAASGATAFFDRTFRSL